MAHFDLLPCSADGAGGEYRRLVPHLLGTQSPGFSGDSINVEQNDRLPGARADTRSASQPVLGSVLDEDRDEVPDSPGIQLAVLLPHDFLDDAAG